MTTGPGELVSPVAELSPERITATRPPELDVRPVALVDAMLHPSAMWGQGMLDMAEGAIAAASPGVAFERVERPQLGGTPPEVWAETMAARYAALVITAGD
jgi:hypothetical protein